MTTDNTQHHDETITNRDRMGVGHQSVRSEHLLPLRRAVCNFHKQEGGTRGAAVWQSSCNIQPWRRLCADVGFLLLHADAPTTISEPDHCHPLESVRCPGATDRNRLVRVVLWKTDQDITKSGHRAQGCRALASAQTWTDVPGGGRHAAGVDPAVFRLCRRIDPDVGLLSDDELLLNGPGLPGLLLLLLRCRLSFRMGFEQRRPRGRGLSESESRRTGFCNTDMGQHEGYAKTSGPMITLPPAPSPDRAGGGGGRGGGPVYGNWPSTAPKAGHGTDLRLTLCAPPHAYSVAPWVYHTLPGRPSGILCPM